ncbi:MAG: hypothetical protein GC164_11325 [Phycisphaera sp.]|nr:hypothetical protein [Phycisphaera sp.]
MAKSKKSSKTSAKTSNKTAPKSATGKKGTATKPASKKKVVKKSVAKTSSKTSKTKSKAPVAKGSSTKPAKPKKKVQPRPFSINKPTKKVAHKPAPPAPATTEPAKPRTTPVVRSRVMIKTTIPAKAPASASTQAVEEPLLPDSPTEAQLKKVKTGLTKKDLEHYRQLLLEKRAQIIGDVESLQTDTKNNGGNLSHMPVHMADIGSDYYEQEFTLGLVESERKLLREINEALERIKKGIYGVCLESAVPITRARLDAKPWAKYCIEVVREREKRGQPT